MTKTDAIISLEDNLEGQELEVPNEIKFFQSSNEFLQYLRGTTDKSFLILQI